MTVQPSLSGAFIAGPTAGRYAENVSELDSHPAAIDTSVYACACPECGAPMSVRLWLATADCWRCETSIALGEVELAALAASQPVAPAPPKSEEPKPVTPPARRGPIKPPSLQRPIHRPVPSPAVAAPPRTSARRPQPVDAVGFDPRELLSWLTSAIVHLVLMILLGLFTFGPEEIPPEILLSVDFDARRAAGEYRNEHAALIVPDFDLPIPDRPRSQREEYALRLADKDARELRLDADATGPSLPPLSRVQEAAASDDPYERMLAIRDPRVRAVVVRTEGGTTLTEAAVARGLTWIARHQNRDGSWSIHRFHRGGECRGRCRGGGSIRSDAGGTALALMAMLGAGQTHRTGIYGDRVAHGLQYLLSIQQPDGDLRGDSDHMAGMYVQAQAALVLCDAFKLTGDEALRQPAQKAIDFICIAQHPAGGWRYVPFEAGDTSVIGWQLMALHSARAAFLEVPPEVLDRAAGYLDAAQTTRDGSRYAYRPRERATPSMTAEGLLSRMYLGWNTSDRGLSRGVEWLVKHHLPDRREPNIYYWYYATQVMHHWGGEPWIDWNRHIRDVLVITQENTGHEAGSWEPNTPHGHQGGRLYMTALACCTLEVYYRHAPLYRKIKL